jgi:hypothetical protein
MLLYRNEPFCTERDIPSIYPLEWESDLNRGVMCARYYPFDMPKHSFHGINPNVMYIHHTNTYIHFIHLHMYILCIYMVYTMFVDVCTILYL